MSIAKHKITILFLFLFCSSLYLYFNVSMDNLLVAERQGDLTEIKIAKSTKSSTKKIIVKGIDNYYK